MRVTFPTLREREQYDNHIMAELITVSYPSGKEHQFLPILTWLFGIWILSTSYLSVCAGFLFIYVGFVPNYVGLQTLSWIPAPLDAVKKINVIAELKSLPFRATMWKENQGGRGCIKENSLKFYKQLRVI